MATSATQLLTRFSFPKVPGDQPWSIIDVTGPASYVRVVPVAPPGAPTGGQRLFAQDFGLQALDFVVAMASNVGDYIIEVIPLGGTRAAPTFFLGGDFESFILRWLDATGGTEAAAGSNLSENAVRLLAIGR